MRTTRSTRTNQPIDAAGFSQSEMQSGAVDRLAGRIMDACAPQLQERRLRASRASVFAPLASWARPAMALAASVILAFLVSNPFAGPREAQPEETLASVLVPSTFAAWLTTDYEPTISELVSDLEDNR